MQNVVLEPEAWVLPRNSLEMKILRLSRPTRSESLGWAPAICTLKSPPDNSDAQYIFKPTGINFSEHQLGRSEVTLAALEDLRIF